MEMKTWTEIRKAADAAGFYHGWMGAEENAMDTLQAASGPEFDALSLRTLEGLLADGAIEAAERDFFVALGIKF
jgi:hypothetical protein